jgi:hypothetical protein
MNNELKQFIEKLIAQKFFGAVELKFESGKVVLARKSENFKFTESYRDNRGENNGNTYQSK